MTPAPAIGTAARQRTRVLLKLPVGHVYLSYEDLAALIEGDVGEPDQVMIVDRFGARAGHATISHDLERLFLSLPGGVRYQMWIRHLVQLRAGARTEAPIRVLAVAGDPTRPVYYQPWRGASA